MKRREQREKREKRDKLQHINKDLSRIHQKIMDMTTHPLTCRITKKLEKLLKRQSFLEKEETSLITEDSTLNISV